VRDEKSGEMRTKRKTIKLEPGAVCGREERG